VRPLSRFFAVAMIKLKITGFLCRDNMFLADVDILKAWLSLIKSFFFAVPRFDFGFDEGEVDRFVTMPVKEDVELLRWGDFV
jgi:hypothetical protein